MSFTVLLVGLLVGNFILSLYYKYGWGANSFARLFLFGYRIVEEKNGMISMNDAAIRH